MPDRQQKQLSVPQTSDVESVGNEIFDAECLKLINEYFYGTQCKVSNNHFFTFWKLQVCVYSLDKTPHTFTWAGSQLNTTYIAKISIKAKYSRALLSL